MWTYPKLAENSKNWAVTFSSSSFAIEKNIKLCLLPHKRLKNTQFLAYDYPAYRIIFRSQVYNYVLCQANSENSLVDCWSWLENNVLYGNGRLTDESKILKLYISKVEPFITNDQFVFSDVSSQKFHNLNCIIRSHSAIFWIKCVPTSGMIHLMTSAFCFQSDDETASVMIPWIELTNVQSCREKDPPSVLNINVLVRNYYFSVLTRFEDFNQVFYLLSSKVQNLENKVVSLFSWQELKCSLHLPSHEKVNVVNECYILHNKTKMFGEIVISTNFLIFRGNKPKLTAVIPIEEIDHSDFKGNVCSLYFKHSQSSLEIGNITKNISFFLNNVDLVRHHKNSEKMEGKYINLFEHNLIPNLYDKLKSYKWTESIDQNTLCDRYLCLSPEIDRLSSQKIPSEFREVVWMLYSGAANLLSINRGYYHHTLLQSQTEVSPFVAEEIEKDLKRTMPEFSIFSSNGNGIESLRRVLMAFACHNKSIGYCQSMNSIVALFLLYCDEEKAFWLLVQLCESSGLDNYYCRDVKGAAVDCYVLTELVHQFVPRLAGVVTENMTMALSISWFLTFFLSILDPRCSAQIFDYFFCFDGPLILFKVALYAYTLCAEIIDGSSDLPEISTVLSSFLKNLSLSSHDENSFDSFIKTARGKFSDLTHEDINFRREKHFRHKVMKTYEENFRSVVENTFKTPKQCIDEKTIHNLLVLCRCEILKMQSFTSFRVDPILSNSTLDSPELHILLDYSAFQNLYAKLSIWYAGKSPESLSHFLFSLIEEDGYVTFVDFVIVLNFIFGSSLADKLILLYQVHLLSAPLTTLGLQQGKEEKNKDENVKKNYKKWSRCLSCVLDDMTQCEFNGMMMSLMDLIVGNKEEESCQLGLQNVIMLIINKTYSTSVEPEPKVRSTDIIGNIIACDEIIMFFESSLHQLSQRVNDLLLSFA